MFVHDGSHLRRFRVSAPFQAALFVVTLLLVVWAGFATIRLFTAPQSAASLSAATEARARQIEQRQALMEAALRGHRIDPSLVAAAGLDGEVIKEGPLAKLEKQQLAQAALIAEALDVRYKVTAAELKKLGINVDKDDFACLCGVIFSDRVGGIECSVCGKPADLEDQFCPSCGARFADKPRLEGKVERKVRRKAEA